MGMYKVLIVDDEWMIRKGIKNAMDWSLLNVEQVFTAESACEAMKAIQMHHPDILITDINMTERTGLELIEEVKREKWDMRIIILTGYERFDYAKQALQLQVHDFLLKPVDEKELAESIIHQEKEIERKRNTENARRTEAVSKQSYLECLPVKGKR